MLLDMKDIENTFDLGQESSNSALSPVSQSKGSVLTLLDVNRSKNVCK